MKALLFRVPTINDRSVRVQIDHGKHFYQTLHFHPELQLTFIKKGKGTLVVGDRIDRFQPYDLLLLGTNVPHVMLNDIDFYDSADQVVSYSFFFKEELLNELASKSPELLHIAEFLREASYGVRIRYENANLLTNRLEEINEQYPFEQLITLLTTLDTLAHSPHSQRLSSTDYQRPQKPIDHQRLENIFNFILTNYHQSISLENVSDVANLTPQAFCRFLQMHTRKTFSQLLNEVRIEHACRLLKDSVQSIADIAMACGYSNLSNFNRQFKQLTGMTPRDYMKKTNR